MKKIAALAAFLFSTTLFAQDDTVLQNLATNKRIVFNVSPGGVLTQAGRIESDGTYVIIENLGIGADPGSLDLFINKANATLRIVALEGQEPALQLYSDDGDDPADRWTLAATTTDGFRFTNDAGGTMLLLKSTGDIIMGPSTGEAGKVIVHQDDNATDGLKVLGTSGSFTRSMLTLDQTNTLGANFTFISAVDSAQGKFFVAGTGDVTNRNGTYAAISDIRLKENISDAPKYLHKLSLVPIKRFSFKVDHLSEANQTGIMAQHLEKIFPELVGEDLQSGDKTVKYSNFIPPIIKGIQELKDKSDRQEHTIEVLIEIAEFQNQSIQNLKERIADLEEFLP